ncbi:2-amino-4-hydroxy-6-hydroxymethyldihydropteridine diphosphokinase [Pseudomonas aeruginosa]|uniref:2-amino-4-hydroxy-6- hydroxymethyldihydropteridine diphosphokinase n=1 Tax=Pseudomonas aeruginosa TaxID=287 RepID=UPI001A27F838|nr:2-amino-4-hydroxy-6-hydroxymethyldihydropteridine diphosphokinase [Pseudomonas aeruginosa]MBG6882999.1 2-amino-4-hydroxy-6-hydroxymethyldihydropteridine diphosphokinase [Pseudomonas aeruginosa]MDI3598777.1 2-amino-4-hydroxy-6-hydroxymethyldihydropteridine diphosphokinase [Pseudomonas aeruginosa]MDI3764062.1 2-amino-4-hydroxy-6-hydroxymethyldihydropteridine diphosphokinase [Pseudomonas aeruginosa]MDV7899218.1 2-amino-4-hydroxy-6-hydroxymethyldihydropteridine diphosphokinase [Pseudomonas aerug
MKKDKFQVNTEFPDATIVAVGSNLRGAHASREELLEAALEALEKRGLHILTRSRVWRSAAWPDPTHPEFRNVLAVVETSLAAMDILAILQEIERQFGRVRHKRNGPRTLDLDLIAVGETVMATDALTLPHPRAYDRRFVMGPLAEVAPNWLHPQRQKTALELATTATVGVDATPIFS